MELQTYLSVLTFLGLVMGFGGGLISQLKKTAIDGDGRNGRQLTSFGKLALAISIIGFAGSFASELLKSQISAQQARDSKKVKDHEVTWKARSNDLATNILENTKSALADILETKFAIAQTQQKVLNDNLIRETRLYGRLSAAGSPLTSLTIKLRIGPLPSPLMSQIQDSLRAPMSTADWEKYQDYIGHHEENYAQEMVDSLFARDVIQPLISLLASNQFISQQGVLVFGLDKGFTVIACLGWLTKPDAFPADDGKKSLLPSGVALVDHLDEGDRRFSREQRPMVNVALEKGTVVLSLQLTSLSMRDALIRYSPGSFTSAALADDIQVFVWNLGDPEEFMRLPFDTVSVHDSILALDGDRKSTAGAPKWLQRIEVQIVPNGVEAISKRYELSLSSEGYPEEEASRGDSIAGYVRLWHGHVR